MASRAIVDSITSWFYAMVFSMLFLISSFEVGLRIPESLDLETTPSSYFATSSLRACLTSKETSGYFVSVFLSKTGCASAGVGAEWSMKSMVPSLYLTCLTVDSSAAFGASATFGASASTLTEP